MVQIFRQNLIFMSIYYYEPILTMKYWKLDLRHEGTDFFGTVIWFQLIFIGDGLWPNTSISITISEEKGRHKSTDNRQTLNSQLDRRIDTEPRLDRFKKWFGLNRYNVFRHCGCYIHPCKLNIFCITSDIKHNKWKPLENETMEV